MRKLVVFILLGIGVLIFAAESNLVARERDYRELLISNSLEVSFAYKYLIFRRQFVDKNNSQYSIAIASHVARQPENKFLSLMKNGGTSLSLLIPIFENTAPNNKPFATQAAYEALVLLVRMPTDAELGQLADYSARVLLDALNLERTSGNSAEVFQVKEVLSMYAAKKRGVAEILGETLDLPDEERAWRNDLAVVRIGLSACSERTTALPIPSRDALERGFGLKWLDREAKAGWDEALIQTVIVSTSSDDCKRFARRYKSMILFTK